MSNKIKLYSYILILTNIILLAHSFVPHNHQHEIKLISQIEVGSNCDICKSKSLEKFSNASESSNDEGCGCCNNGKDSCPITFGYFNQANEELLLNNIIVDFCYCILFRTLDLSCEISNKKEQEFFDRVSIVKCINLYGIGMRAPPVFIS